MTILIFVLISALFTAWLTSEANLLIIIIIIIIIITCLRTYLLN